MNDSPPEVPERATLRAEMRKLLESRIDSLPEAFRSVFVLRALEETEDALVTHARTRDSLQQAAEAAYASQTAARIARTVHEGGLVDFLDVLDAERTQLVAEDRLAQSRTDAATSLIAVYKSLGGSWQQAPQPHYVHQTGG